jgi:hypothetical protein
MESPIYAKLINVVSAHIGEAKARQSIERQVKKISASPETLTSENLQSILQYVVGATTLYLHPDKAKQEQLTAEIRALVS